MIYNIKDHVSSFICTHVYRKQRLQYAVYGIGAWDYPLYSCASVSATITSTLQNFQHFLITYVFYISKGVM